MSKIAALRERLEIIQILSEYPADTPISNEDAAIYLDRSPKTLSRMRSAGTGPLYAQPKTKAGTTARNQDIFYVLKDLRAWVDEQRISSTLEAAKDRGLCFDSIPDLFNDQPFWVKTITEETKGGLGRGQIQKSHDVIIGHIQTVPTETFKQLLSDPTARMMTCSLDDAMKKPWATSDARQPFQNAYVELLRQSIEVAELQGV